MSLLATLQALLPKAVFFQLLPFRFSLMLPFKATLGPIHVITPTSTIICFFLSAHTPILDKYTCNKELNN